jgi:phenylacetate-CoA ligase
VPGKEGFRLLQSKLLVEILDTNGDPVNYGERGEIVLTGGFNDYLPLIRYRTGDFGRLELEDGNWYIKDLEGRPPIQYKTKDGVWLNNVDVTHMLQGFPLSQFSLHQDAGGKLTITLPSDTYSEQIKQSLETKFGQQVQVNLFEKVSSDKKVIQYTSDLRNSF